MDDAPPVRTPRNRRPPLASVWSRTARYWWHMLKTLAEPRDPYHSAQADDFQTNKHWVGYNPFYPEPISVTPGLGEWMGREYIEDLARFCQRSAEETYLRIAAGQGQASAKYMREAPSRQLALAGLGALSKGKRNLPCPGLSRCLQLNACV